MPGSRFVAFIISNQCGQVLAVGLMAIENLFRYPALAVGLKPSAMRGEARLRGLERAVADYLLKDHKPSAIQGEARLRGLWRIMYSKTISPRLARAKPACASERGLFTQNHKPPASQGEARLRGLARIIYSKTISPRLARAKPACAGERSVTHQDDQPPFSLCGRRGRGGCLQG